MIASKLRKSRIMTSVHLRERRTENEEGRKAEIGKYKIK